MRLCAAVAGLTLAALVLRFWALTWGVPNAGRYYLYHPDEATLVNAVCQVSPTWGDFFPSFYSYGSFTILLVRWLHDLGMPLAGLAPAPVPGDPNFPAHVGDLAQLLLLGRWVTVVLGALTVPVTYKLGERLFGRRVGLIAAAFLAVTPLAVVLGHYFTVDVPATFLSTLALMLAAVALREPEPRRAAGWIVGAGFAAGLAGGTKYNTLVAAVGIVPVLFGLWRKGGTGRRWGLIAACGAASTCGLAFLLATPGAVVETRRFLADLNSEFVNNEAGQGLVFKGTLPAPLYHLLISLPVGLEWPLYLLCLGGVGWSLRRRRREDFLLLLFLAAVFVPLALAERMFVRYALPMVPALLVLAGRLVDEGLHTPRGRWFTGAAGLSGAAALASTVAHLGVFAATDARDQAADFLRASSRPEDVVALGGDAWYYTPPIHPTTGCVKVGAPYGGPPVWDVAPPGGTRPDLFRLDGLTVLAPRSYELRPTAQGMQYFPATEGALSVDKLRRYRPKRVVLSDFEWEDAERLRRADPAYRNGTLDLLDALAAEGYRVEREFRPRPSLPGFTWWSRGMPPHDWRYFMPTIRVYARD